MENKISPTLNKNEAVCMVCHKKFTKTRYWQKYCSPKCRKEAFNSITREKSLSSPARILPGILSMPEMGRGSWWIRTQMRLYSIISWEISLRPCR